jgi:hypothetical protein
VALELVDRDSRLELVGLTVLKGDKELEAVAVADGTKFDSLEWIVTNIWSDVEDEVVVRRVNADCAVVATGIGVEELLCDARMIAVKFEAL